MILIQIIMAYALLCWRDGRQVMFQIIGVIIVLGWVTTFDSYERAYAEGVNLADNG